MKNYYCKQKNTYTVTKSLNIYFFIPYSVIFNIPEYTLYTLILYNEKSVDE